MAVMQVNLLDERPLTTHHGRFSTRLYRGADGSVGAAVWTGQLDGAAVLSSRLHSSCFTSEGLSALDCDCVAQLDLAFGAIAREGRGVVFYLLQEGRGAGLLNKIRDRALVQSSGGSLDTFAAYERLGLRRDPRTYALVPAICADLGIAPALRLMTNNPAKIAALQAAGIAVERVDHSPPGSDFNSEYLAAQARSGYAQRPRSPTRAVAPAGLEQAEPGRAQLGRFTRAASYSMPVRRKGGVVWLRATAYAADGSPHVRMVLSLKPRGRQPVLHVFREELFERFTQQGAVVGAYRQALDALATHGGSVLAVPSDARLLTSQSGPSAEEDLALLRAHDGALAEEAQEVA